MYVHSQSPPSPRASPGINCVACRHMHREAFRTWEREESGGGGDGGRGGITGDSPGDSPAGGDGGGSGADVGGVDGDGGGKEAAAGDDGVERKGRGAAGQGEEVANGAGGNGDTAANGAGSADVAAGASKGAAASESGSGRARRKPGMDDSKVHIFTSHFFTKLTEGGRSCGDEVSQSTVWFTRTLCIPGKLTHFSCFVTQRCCFFAPWPLRSFFFFSNTSPRYSDPYHQF